MFAVFNIWLIFYFFFVQFSSFSRVIRLIKKSELCPSSARKTSCREILSAFPLDGGDVLLPTFDALMSECAPKRPRRYSRFTDDKTSEASAVDDDFQQVLMRNVQMKANTQWIFRLVQN